MATSYKGAWANGMTLIYRNMETICVASRGRQTDGVNKQHLEVCPVAGKTNCLTTVAKDNLVMEISTKQINPNGGCMVADEQQPDGRIRRLTPTECARLQTVPDWYKWRCSNAQQYKMLGNGWTVEVIKHILSFLPDSLLYPESMEATTEQGEEKQQKCGNCVLCVHTYLGGECGLTDNPVDYELNGCIDYITED